MRILYAHSFYRIAGGEDRHVRDQVELVSRAHDVELISASNADLPDAATTAIRMMYSRARKHEIGGVIDRFAPEIVHIHNAYPSLGPSVILAAHERGIPIVMTVHNMRLRCPNGLMFTQGSLCRRCEAGMYTNAVIHQCFPTKSQASGYASTLWLHRFGMRLERRIAGFVAPSDFMRGRLLEWGFASERVTTIRHFVSESRHAGSPLSLGTYGIFVGRLSAEKGADVLLTALQHAGDPRFVFVGDGPQRSVLHQRARELGLVNTTFLGWQAPDAVPGLVRGSRYMAMPSVSEENAPLSALEALAAGRPLLVSAIGGLPELVSSGSGVSAVAGDPEDLADKIKLLEGDDNLCRRSSAMASAYAHRWLTGERHLRTLERVYQALIERRRAA